VFRRGNEAAFDGVAVQVIQLLQAFLLAPEVHIVESPLPDTIVGVSMNRART
jgi:hypothetical protein